MRNHPLRALAVALLGLLALAPAALAQGKKYALLVGVTDYDNANFRALKFPNRDASELARVLQKDGFAEVRVLTPEEGKKNKANAPTAANIKKALEKLLAGKKRQDTVWIGLAGHGLQLRVTKGEQTRVLPCFCPQDAETIGVDFATGTSPTLVNLNVEVFEQLHRCGAGTKIVLVDACRNEAEGQTRSLASENVTVPKGVCAMFSCTNDTVAYEHPKLRHGVFFYFAIKALQGEADNGDGEVTWGRFTEYVARNVVRTVPDLIKDGATQLPHAYSNHVGESPVLVKLAKSVRKPIDESVKLYQEGLNRMLGTGEPVDEARAARLFRQAVREGEPKAAAALAFMLHNGFGGDKDTDEAERLVKKHLEALQRAAEKDPDAANWLGLVYWNGIGVKQDGKEGVKWFREAQKTNHSDAMDNLGNAYLYGQGVEQDFKEAYRWFKKAADAGLPSAMRHQAVMLLSGLGVEKDQAHAFKLYKRSAGRGYPQAVTSVGKAYLLGWGVKPNAREAREWLERAVDKGDPEGMYSLGHLYITGTGVGKDHEKGLDLVKRAIDKGNFEAMNYLAGVYLQGKGGVTRNEKEALKYYRKAAEFGHAAAMYELGNLHFKGQAGLEPNDRAALEWWRKGAKLQHAPCTREVGAMYWQGRGVKRDDPEAVSYFRKAAAKGDAVAMYFLGLAYEEGRGVDRQTREALRWYREAAKKGHPGAKDRIEALSKST